MQCLYRQVLLYDFKTYSTMFQWIQKEPLSLNLGGELVSLSRPLIMGILNITPDSFYPGSRTTEEEQIAERLRKMMNEGADIIDIGAYSSRSNADDISPDEEMKRLSKGLDIIRKLYPTARVSVDTFRADIAARCVREYGVESRLYFDAHERDAPNHDATNPIRAYHSRNALLFLRTYRPTRKPRCQRYHYRSGIRIQQIGRRQLLAHEPTRRIYPYRLPLIGGNIS